MVGTGLDKAKKLREKYLQPYQQSHGNADGSEVLPLFYIYLQSLNLQALFPNLPRKAEVTWLHRLPPSYFIVEKVSNGFSERE